MSLWPAYAVMFAVVLAVMAIAAVPAIVLVLRQKRIKAHRGFEVITKPDPGEGQEARKD